ncbi:MAG: hypothetical protein JST22_19900 [Bacteroidetes bacterium]|nr:hypothetical protein [Bacteroidota bacterium]
MNTIRTRRITLLGILAAAMLAVSASPGTALARHPLCTGYTVFIDGTIPDTMKVGVDFQNLSTTMHPYTVAGTYHETVSNPGAMLDVVITLGPCGGPFTVPADGMPHRISGLASCNLCYNVTAGTDLAGCPYIAIIQVPC